MAVLDVLRNNKGPVAAVGGVLILAIVAIVVYFMVYKDRYDGKAVSMMFAGTSTVVISQAPRSPSPYLKITNSDLDLKASVVLSDSTGGIFLRPPAGKRYVSFTLGSAVFDGYATSNAYLHSNGGILMQPTVAGFTYLPSNTPVNLNVVGKVTLANA